jgi:hypothetical protein
MPEQRARCNRKTRGPLSLQGNDAARRPGGATASETHERMDLPAPSHSYPPACVREERIPVCPCLAGTRGACCPKARSFQPGPFRNGSGWMILKEWYIILKNDPKVGVEPTGRGNWSNGFQGGPSFNEIPVGEFWERVGIRTDQASFNRVRIAGRGRKNAWQFWWQLDLRKGRISSYSPVLVLKHEGPRNVSSCGPSPVFSMAPRAGLESTSGGLTAGGVGSARLVEFNS